MSNLTDGSPCLTRLIMLCKAVFLTKDGTAYKADKLSAGRTIKVNLCKHDEGNVKHVTATGEAVFDGSGDIEIDLYEVDNDNG